MKKCECYEEYVRERSATAFEKGVHFGRTGKMIEKVTETVSRCRGTKECEPCKCGGDRRKCDFYPENRLPENVAKYEKEHAPKFGKWISVEDELPPISQDVLVYTEKGNINIDFCYTDESMEGTGEIGFYFHCDVDFWMPLPEPPKESDS